MDPKLLFSNNSDYVVGYCIIKRIHSDGVSVVLCPGSPKIQRKEDTPVKYLSSYHWHSYRMLFFVFPASLTGENRR